MDKKNKDIYMNEIKMYIDIIGSKVYKNSKEELHRLDGPAIEYPNGTNWWYKNDKLHRVDGPACELINVYKIWYILNKELKEKEFNSWVKRIKIILINSTNEYEYVNEEYIGLKMNNMLDGLKIK